MHYQLFLPGKQGASPSNLVEVGLPDLTAGAMFTGIVGPGDQPGVLVSWNPPGTPLKIGYRPDLQTWRQSDSAAYWIGFWNGERPRPEDLQRERQFAGDLVELGDGRQWRIPIASALPRDYLQADDGTWRFVAQPEYRELADVAESWCEQFRGDIAAGNVPGVDMDQARAFLEKLLALNYRLVPEVSDRLQFWNQRIVKIATATAVPELVRIVMEAKGDQGD